MLTSLSNLDTYIPKQTVKKRLVVAAIQDTNIFEAVLSAHEKDLVDVILTGKKNDIDRIAGENGYDLSGMEILDLPTDEDAAQKAVKLARHGDADIIMNGEENQHGALVLGKMARDKKSGITEGRHLSLIALFEIENYHKLIAVTDVLINIAPDIKTKMKIINNAVFLMRRLGIMTPKVAVLAAVEVVNQAMNTTIDAALLSKMAQRNQIKNCIVDGPLAFDNAINKESAIHKKIINEVAGDADILLAPGIESANVLYQSFMFFASARAASLVMGATVPIILTSKMDRKQTRVDNIALGVCCYLDAQKG
ncbi:MAG: bifunctional enoyl-CoA hydratase/phosphate acetyltransferase [bacterium]|nr:bifunctional enoyl-CoA hydratase/phosphate acetyltransferase [bacterium]